MTREQFESQFAEWMLYDLRRLVVVHTSDTLFNEAQLFREAYEQIEPDQYLVPMLDVLWARSLLEHINS